MFWPMGLPDIDLAKLEALLKLSRSENVLQLKIADVEFTLAPQPMTIPNMSELDPEDLGLPGDPGDPNLDPRMEHTSPYIPPGTKPMKQRKRKVSYSEGGEMVVDPQNPLNPDNPVDFSQDFPDLPPVPGYGNGRMP
jgi:hypothetical protein